jgi:hypothetical protein
MRSIPPAPKRSRGHQSGAPFAVAECTTLGILREVNYDMVTMGKQAEKSIPPRMGVFRKNLLDSMPGD